MENCKNPTCVYSIKSKKCIKPNPYIQYISYCRNLSKNKSLNECKELYKDKIDEIKINACAYYKKNLIKKDSKINTCPKNRRPDNNDICPDDFKNLKLNKHNVKCCYKVKNSKIKVLSNDSTNSFNLQLKNNFDILKDLPSKSSDKTSSSSSKSSKSSDKPSSSSKSSDKSSSSSSKSSDKSSSKSSNKSSSSSKSSDKSSSSSSFNLELKNKFDILNDLSSKSSSLSYHTIPLKSLTSSYNTAESIPNKSSFSSSKSYNMDVLEELSNSKSSDKQLKYPLKEVSYDILPSNSSKLSSKKTSSSNKSSKTFDLNILSSKSSESLKTPLYFEKNIENKNYINKNTKKIQKILKKYPYRKFVKKIKKL